MRQASTCGRVRAFGSGHYSKCSKTVEVGYSCYELKPCQREITTDEIQEKNILEPGSAGCTAR